MNYFAEGQERSDSLRTIEAEFQSLRKAMRPSKPASHVPCATASTDKLLHRIRSLESKVEMLSSQLNSLQPSFLNIDESSTIPSESASLDRRLATLESLTSQRLASADNLISYLITFKSTADQIPVSILSKVSRTQMLLDPLPEDIRAEVYRRGDLHPVRPLGHLANHAEGGLGRYENFDGVFVLVAEIAKEEAAWGWRGGGGAWTELRRDSVHETDLRKWVRLRDMIERAWDGHVAFLVREERRNRRKWRVRRQMSADWLGGSGDDGDSFVSAKP